MLSLTAQYWEKRSKGNTLAPTATAVRSWRWEFLCPGEAGVRARAGWTGGVQNGDWREPGSAAAFGISLADWHCFVPLAGELAQRPAQLPVAGCWDSRPSRRAEVPCYWGLLSPRHLASYNVQVIPDPVSAKGTLCTFPTMIFPLT